jgi:hypothetical protein
MISASAPASPSSAAVSQALCPRPNHGDAFVAKAVEISVIGSMADQRSRGAREDRGAELVAREARGDDHASGEERLAVGERQQKSIAGRLDASDQAPIEVGHGASLKPLAITDESFDGQRFDQGGAFSSDQAPSESAFSGSEMSVAARGERNFMPLGMLRRQNDIDSPNVRVATPRDFKWAATASP